MLFVYSIKIVSSYCSATQCLQNHLIYFHNNEQYHLIDYV